MKSKIFLITFVLLLCFSACATQKKAPLIQTQSSNYKFCLIQGSAFLKQGETDKAMAQFNRALALNPNSAQVHNLLGMAYFKKENYHEAEKEIKKAIELDSSYAPAYNNLGGIYFLNQDLDNAKIMLEKTLSLDPNIISAYYSLGTLLVTQGQFEEGLKYLSRGFEFDPDYLEKNKAFTKDFTSSSFSSGEVNFTYAKLYASVGNVEKTVLYLKMAKHAGFKDWPRIDQEKEFEKVRDDPRIRELIKS